jgi:hypothetical protein
MAFEIISKEDVAKMIRLPIAKIEDTWYDQTLGLIEQYTGLFSLSEAQDIDDVLDGDGGYYLSLQRPLNSVSSVWMDGYTIPANYYLARWDGLYLKTYYTVNLPYESNLRYANEFTPGIGNIQISYNAGGVVNLPSKYYKSLQATIVLCLQAWATMPREEGSDQLMRNFRPVNQEYQRKDEALSERGVHGKIRDIIRTTLPKRTVMK